MFEFILIPVYVSNKEKGVIQRNGLHNKEQHGSLLRIAEIIEKKPLFPSTSYSPPFRTIQIPIPFPK